MLKFTLKRNRRISFSNTTLRHKISWVLWPVIGKSW